MLKQMWLARLNAAWRYKWLFVFAVILGLVWGMLNAISQTPQYRATLTLLLEPEGYYSDSTSGITSFYTWKSLATQHALIQSRSLAERVIDGMELLDRQPLLNVPEREYQSSLLLWAGPVMQKVKASLDGLKLRRSGQGGPAKTPGRADRDALTAMIRSGLSVKGDTKTELLYMNFDSPDPVFAQEIVNRIAEEYILQQEEATLTRAQRKSSWLSERLTELRGQLQNSINKLQAYRVDESVGDTGSLVDRSNSRILFLETNVTDKRLELDALAAKYGDKHPKIITAKGQLAEAEEFLATEQEKVLNSREKEFQLKELELEVQSNREIYELFLSHLRELDLSSTQKIRDVRIVDHADLPVAPFSPNEGHVIRLRVLWAATIGLGLIALIVLLDNKFRDPEQAEQILQIPAIGSLPLLRRSELSPEIRDAAEIERGTKLAPEFFCAARPTSVFAEAVNHVQAGIIFSNPDNPPHVIVVSSSLEGEGKTTLATNLATAFSRLGRTLLVDGDLRKPRLAKLARIRPSAGLTDLIVDRSGKEKCILKSKVNPNLCLLSHGMIPPDPHELLSSNSFEDLLGELKSSFQHIIIDASPILPVSDPIILAHRSNGLVLVVEANRTTQWTARMTAKKLAKANVNVLGLVLTKMDSRRAYYYSNYRNYYASYTGPRTNSDDRRRAAV